MQAAARKVLDENERVLEENKRLRALLIQAGYSEAQISGSVARGTEPTRATPTLASPILEKPMSLAKEGLEKLLLPRSSCECGMARQSEEAGTNASSSPRRVHVQSPVSMLPSQPLQQSNALTLGIAAPVLLSPNSQSYPSSCVSSPNSGYDVLDDYSISSPELTATVAQPTPRAQMVQSQHDMYQLAGAFSFQMDFEPQPTSWPRLSTQHRAVSPCPPQVGVAPTSSPALSDVDVGCSYGSAGAGDLYGVGAMGQVVLPNCKTREHEMAGYPAISASYSDQTSLQRWQ